MDLRHGRAWTFGREKPFFDEMETQGEERLGENGGKDEVCRQAIAPGCALPACGQDMRDAHSAALSCIGHVLGVRRRITRAASTPVGQRTAAAHRARSPSRGKQEDRQGTLLQQIEARVSWLCTYWKSGCKVYRAAMRLL